MPPIPLTYDGLNNITDHGEAVGKEVQTEDLQRSSCPWRQLLAYDNPSILFSAGPSLCIKLRRAPVGLVLHPCFLLFFHPLLITSLGACDLFTRQVAAPDRVPDVLLASSWLTALMLSSPLGTRQGVSPCMYRKELLCLLHCSPPLQSLHFWSSGCSSRPFDCIYPLGMTFPYIPLMWIRESAAHLLLVYSLMSSVGVADG